MIKIELLLEEEKFGVIATTNLIENYFLNLVGMLRYEGSFPGLKVDRLSSNSAEITIKVDNLSKRVEGDWKKDEELRSYFEELIYLVRRFSIIAFDDKILKYEFIPLSGYPSKDLKVDVKQALLKKRSLVLIDDFQSYKDFMLNSAAEYNQYFIPFDSDEYTEVYLMISEGKIKELRNKYKSKLKKFSWM